MMGLAIFLGLYAALYDALLHADEVGLYMESGQFALLIRAMRMSHEELQTLLLSVVVILLFALLFGESRRRS